MFGRISKDDLSQHHIIKKTTYVLNEKNAEEQVVWPNSRNLNVIESLYGIKFTQIFSGLNPSSNVLDIGPGKGTLLSELADKFGFKCYGITTTKLDPNNEAKAKEISYCAVPNSKSWLERHREFYNVCLDTYASLTYADNALHSLIYILLSIAPGGKFYSMSSLTPGDNEHSRFGDSNTRKSIQQFFKEIFNVDLHFDLVQIESKACKPGTYMDDLRITFQVPQEGIKLPKEYTNSTTWNLFKMLCNCADNKIGVPVLRQNTTSFSAGKYHITMCDFVVPNEITLVNRPSI